MYHQHGAKNKIKNPEYDTDERRVNTFVSFV